MGLVRDELVELRGLRFHYRDWAPDRRPVAERMAASIADCRLVEVAGSGHPVPLDKPDAFVQAVATFL